MGIETLISEQPIIEQTAFPFNLEKIRQSFLRNQELFDSSTQIEAVRRQVYTFTQEYLTNLTFSEYEYILDEKGNFTALGWGRVEDSYERALNEGGITNQQRLIRLAELNSFKNIQKHFQVPENENNTLVLQSPDQGWGYSYISFYTKIDNRIKVKLYRLWEDDRFFSHKQVRNFYCSNPNIEGYELYERLVNLSEIENNDLEILASVIVIPQSGNEVFDPQNLIEKYYDDFSSFNYEGVDLLVRQQLETFQGEIEKLVQALIKEAIFDENDYIQYLDQFFRIFLVKAKVHFDEQGARALWDHDYPQLIDKIKETINNDQEDQSLSALSVRDDILSLNVFIRGSCGDIEVQVGSISTFSLLKALNFHKNLVGVDEYGALIFICNYCGGVCKRPADEFLEKCPICGTIFTQCGNNMSINLN